VREIAWKGQIRLCCALSQADHGGQAQDRRGDRDRMRNGSLPVSDRPARSRKIRHSFNMLNDVQRASFVVFSAASSHTGAI
jgi:hypothetical protein